MLLALGLGLLVILVGPLVIVVRASGCSRPTPDVARSSSAISRSACSARPRRSASMVLLGWLLGLQDSRRPLLLMMLTNGINAVLAVLFVFGLGMAAAGRRHWPR